MAMDIVEKTITMTTDATTAVTTEIEVEDTDQKVTEGVKDTNRTDITLVSKSK